MNDRCDARENLVGKSQISEFLGASSKTWGQNKIKKGGTNKK